MSTNEPIMDAVTYLEWTEALAAWDECKGSPEGMRAWVDLQRLAVQIFGAPSHVVPGGRRAAPLSRSEGNRAQRRAAARRQPRHVT